MNGSSWPDWVFWLALAALGLNLLLVLVLLLKRPRRPDDVASRGEVQQLIGAAVGQHGERLERELRQEIGVSAREGRQELSHALATFQDAMVRQGAEGLRTQNAQVDALGAQLTQLRGTLGDTLVQQLQALGLGMAQQAAEAGDDAVAVVVQPGADAAGLHLFRALIDALVTHRPGPPARCRRPAGRGPAPARACACA